MQKVLLALILFLSGAASATTLRGRVVVNLTGAPIAAATATLRSDGAVVASTTTDAEGAFALEGLPPGRAGQLAVEADGCLPTTADVPPASTQPLRIVLSRGGLLTGRVLVTSSSQPASGATVETTSPRTTARTTTADASGQYRFGSLTSDAVDVRASHQGMFSWKPAERVRVRPGQETRIAALLLEPGWTARMDVRDTSGRFISDAILRSDAFSASITAASTVGPLPPWRSSLVVSASGYVDSNLPFPSNLRPGETRVLAATLELRGRVQGVVRNATGEAIMGARLAYTLRQPDPESGRRECALTTDASGRFQFTLPFARGGVPAHVQKEGYAPWDGRLTAGDAIHDVTLASGGTLWGRVRLADGKVPDSATTTLQPHGGKAATFAVDSEGLWRARDVAVGTATLYAEAPGLVSDTVQALVVAGKEIEAPELVLTPGLRFEGTVVEEGSEKPIPGIRVMLKRTLRDADAYSAVSDDNGRFDVRGVRPGEYVCTVEDMRPTTDRQQVFKSEESGEHYGALSFKDADILNYRIEGKPAARIEGTVLDAETELPIPNAEMKASPTNGFSRDAMAYETETKTDDRGVFALLVNAGERRHQLYASAADAGYTDEFQMVNLPEQGHELSDVVIRLSRGVLIGGTVLDATGNPAMAAQVVVREGGDAARGVRTTSMQTDDKGFFQISPLRPGRYVVWAQRFSQSHASPPPSALDLTLSAGESRTDLLLILAEESAVAKGGGTLAGIVMDGQKKPVAGARISVRCQEPWSPGDQVYRRQGDTSSEPDGKFRMDGLRLGRFSATVTHNKATYHMDDVVVPKTDYVITLATTGGIAGRVEGTFGEKVTQFRIEARPNEPPRPEGRMFPEAPETPSPGLLVASGDGSFKLESLAPGSYRLAVEAEGYAPRLTEPIEVKSGEITEGVVVHLSGGGDVEFHVTDSQGEPVSGAWVFLADEMREITRYGRPLPTSWRRATREDGLYIFHRQPDRARLAVVFLHPSFAPAEVEVLVVAGRTQRVEVLLGPVCAVEGTVYDRDNKPMPDRDMAAANTSPTQAYRQIRTRTDTNGHYRLGPLAPGLWYVVAFFGHDQDQEDRHVSLNAGETATLDFHQGAGRLYGVLTKAGTPVAGIGMALVSSAPPGGGRTWVSATSGQDGRFEWTGFGAGEYTISFSIQNGPSRSIVYVLKSLQLRDNEVREMNIQIPTGIVRGTVVDGADHPVAQAKLEIMARYDQFLRGVIGQWRTSSDGRFEFDGLPEGKCPITATSQENKEWAPGKTTVTLRDGEVVEDVKIVLDAGGYVEGVVRTGGEVVALPPGTDMVLLPSGDAADLPEDTKAVPLNRETCQFKSKSVPPGEYVVLVEPAGGQWAWQQRDVTVKTGETARVEFDLVQGVRLHLRLQTGADTTLPGTVNVNCVDGRGRRARESTNVPASALYLYDQIAFPRDAFHFTLKAKGFKDAVVDVDLTNYPGAEKDVVIVMEKE